MKQSCLIFSGLIKAKDNLVYYINKFFYNDREKKKDDYYSISYNLKTNGIINIKVNFRKSQKSNMLFRHIDLNTISFI